MSVIALATSRLAHFRQEVLRLHFNFRFGADVPKVAVEGKFGPRAYTSISECSLVPEVADECKFGPCAYTSVSRCLMSLTWPIKQIAVGRVGTPILEGRCSDHVLAQARLTGLLRCMSNLVGMRQRRLDHVLAQAVTGLLRCKGAVASFTTPKFSLARSPEVADGCKFRSCAYTSICSCLMSLTGASYRLVAG